MLHNEFKFAKEQEIQPIIDLSMSELMQRVYQTMLSVKQLRGIAQKILIELIKY